MISICIYNLYCAVNNLKNEVRMDARLKTAKMVKEINGYNKFVIVALVVSNVFALLFVSLTMRLIIDIS